MRHLASEYNSRPYRHSEDFEAVMGFLRETYVETGACRTGCHPDLRTALKEMRRTHASGRPEVAG